mmetsp:Transcript_44156/g.66732  ORF Transcript_44156/g.66732 Transcript_44156/m.66732 type:complete len:155 (+) Transcript_44156:38-502(+)|eukprot:CAMPEP_0206454250 /NCGR_PEP_ID=MMETSP0324_2-20121206/21025_1 /ASSEMBLY_ACC=CAM_ASM_000836 /TAXON_ID=2866 /ORGANISM="Crypthecodinium cohnii, Strain Seligo" /LENGTH=154 /DNA_ID=CAMNT_0053924687 /DNA_START=141 /DNA_END=605 /DNA_ORIENTATION=+
MAFKFRLITLPIAVLLASAYFWFITQKQIAKKDQDLKDMGITVTQKATSCHLKAKKGDMLHVHYSGYLKSSGKLYESTRDSKDPYVFKLGTCNDKRLPECLKGFERGVIGMCAGEKRKVTVPPKMAFGAIGRAPDVPPDDTIIFNIELVDVDSF